MDSSNRDESEITPEQEDLLKRVAEVAARRLTPLETHSICVLLSMAFGRRTVQARTFAQHINAIRIENSLPPIADIVAGNPTSEEKMLILQSALEKLGEAEPVLIQVLLLSPLDWAWCE